MANSPKNDHLSTAEPCALYYFPEIPNAANRETKTASPARFTSGPFKGKDKPSQKDMEQQDPAHLQAQIEEAFNNGLNQGRAETSAALEKKINTAAASLQAVVKELQRIRQHDVERMEAETVRLALAICKKIIGYETQHQAVIQHVVKLAMEKVNDTRQLVIRLNPHDLEVVQDHHQALLPEDDIGTTFRLEADDGIKRGGCVIETKLGDIDARIDSQLKIIEELLMDQIPKSTISG